MATLWDHLVHPDGHSHWQTTSSSLASLANCLYLLCASLSLSRTQTKSGNDKRPSQPSQTTDQSEPVSLWTSAIWMPGGENDADQMGSKRTKSLSSPRAGRPCLTLMCILHRSSWWIQSVKKCIWRKRHRSVLRLYGMDLGLSVPGRSHSWQS